MMFAPVVSALGWALALGRRAGPDRHEALLPDLSSPAHRAEHCSGAGTPAVLGQEDSGERLHPAPTFLPSTSGFSLT